MKIIKVSKDITHQFFQFLSRLVTNEKLYEGALLIFIGCIFISFHDLIARFHETPFDGVFQTLFALRKMDAGEFPGRDFFYFHGNGIPYLLYPIYWILHKLTGQELSSSLWSTFIINIIFLYGPIYVFFLKKYGRRYAASALLIISLINEFLFFFGFYNSPLFIGAPMGVRLAPHLLVLFTFSIYIKEKNDVNFKKSLYVLGMLLGVSALIAAEQGVFAILGSFFAIVLIENTWRDKLKNSFILLSVSVLTFLTLQLVLFGGFDSIRAMKIISDNQVWVYGVFPNVFFANIYEVFSFSKVLAIPSQITTLLASIVVFILAVEKKRNPIYLISIFAMYFGGMISWISNIGYVGQHQSAIFMKLLIIVALVFIFDKCKQENEQK